MVSLQEFYSEPHLDLADGFGSLAGGRTNPHRGLDVNGWPVGTYVHALYAGTVVRSELQSGLGNVVCVRTDAGFYEGSAHLSERWVVVGQRINVGDIVGLLGATGSLCHGAHTHKTISLVSDNPSTGSVVDPLPYVRAARDAVVAAPVAAPVVKPVAKAAKPAPKPAKPVEPVAPVVPVAVFDKVAADAAIASLPAADLGVIIPSARGRVAAYAAYMFVSLAVTNVAVGYTALGTGFPDWLKVAIAVVGNLATPFGALAIANARKPR